jgi:hypothetical protein
LDFGTGTVNGMVLFLLVLLTVASIWFTIYLSNNYPGKQWLGIILSIVFTPWGQLYLEGSTRYIIALVMITGFSKALLGTYLLPFICSPIMMWCRFNKLSKTKNAVKKSE